MVINLIVVMIDMLYYKLDLKLGLVMVEVSVKISNMYLM